MTISALRKTTTITDQTTQATFLLPSDDTAIRSTLLVTTISRAGAWPDEQLCLLVEPVEPSPLAATSAAGIIATIHEFYQHSTAADPLETLTTAIEAANRSLYDQNRQTAPGNRVLLGLTCLIIRGDELLICQVPPTQLLLSQGGELVELPKLASWRQGYQPHSRDDRQGLGATNDPRPQLFRTTLEDGDLITICTSTLARGIEGSPTGLAPLLGTDAEAAIAYLATRVGRDENAANSYALSLAPTVEQGWHHEDLASDNEEDAVSDDSAGWWQRSMAQLRQRLPFGQHQRTIVDEGDETTPNILDDEWDDLPAASPYDSAGQVVRMTETGWGQHPAGAQQASPATENDPLADLLPSRRRQRANPLHTVASAVAMPVLIVGSMVERLKPAPRPDHDTRLLENRRKRTRPLGNLERYQPGGLPLGRALPVLLLVGLIVALVILFVSLRNYQARVEQTKFDTAVAQVTHAREAAVANQDHQAGYLQLLALPEQLKAIPNADRPGRQDRLSSELKAIGAALDQVAGVQRLGGNAVNLVAALPGGLTSTGIVGRPQLAIGNGRQYLLLNGTVYMADGRGAMTKILAKGDIIGGTAVGNLLGLVWRDTSLFAFTETQGVVRDNNGSWSLSPLAATGQKVTATESYEGNLYLLTSERGQIMKFPAGSYTQSPQAWANPKMQPELNQAVDFAVDKDIYVLLNDGRILDLFQGEGKAALNPGIVPPLNGAVALTAALNGKWLYVLDPREGRIVRMSRTGDQATTFKPALDSRGLNGARELTVDEVNNILYLLTDEGIISVRLP